MVAINAKVAHEMITYPLSTPSVKVNPAKAGPMALPRAEMLVETPLRVPRIFKLAALFVRRIVEHGNAKMPAKHLTSIIPSITPCLRESVGSSAVKGVAMYANGKTAEQALRQFKNAILPCNWWEHEELDNHADCTINGKEDAYLLRIDTKSTGKFEW